MKKITLYILFLTIGYFSYAQMGDTLSYKITSVYSNGAPRMDRLELSNRVVVNAFEYDGNHYCWTKILTPDDKEKELYEFEYSEPGNYNSILTIKKYFASYRHTDYSGSNYSGYYTSVTTTVVTTSTKPSYTIDKIIKVYEDKIVVYKYAGGHLWWTYYYTKDGVLEYGINGEKKWLYEVTDSIVNETSPTGEKERYIIGEDGYARKEGGNSFSSWADVEVGKLVPHVILPNYKRK